MAHYQIPRQPTTRIELVTGVGLVEVGAVLAAATVGYLIGMLLRHFDLGELAFWVTVACGLGGFFLVQGGQSSLAVFFLRQFRFMQQPRLLLYRVGTGGRKAPAPRTNVPPSGVATVRHVPKRKGTQAPSTLPKSVQTWLPVGNVGGGLIYRTDQQVVAVVRVEPVNLGLRSATEQHRIVSLLHEAINALPNPAQILSMPRPLDLEHYVKSLETRLHELDPARQRLLTYYVQHVCNLVTGGEARERRYFILLPQAGGASASRDVLQRAHDLIARLRQADLGATLLTDVELLDLLYIWGHPGQAAFERPPEGPPGMTTFMEE